MTVLDRNRIDVIATRPESSVVRLIISDHLGWRDLNGHLLAVRNKVEDYVAFVESGQLLRVDEPPIPSPHSTQIELVLAERAPAGADQFFAEVRDLLAGLDITFVVRHRAPRDSKPGTSE